jgi:hypothetical protein
MSVSSVTNNEYAETADQRENVASSAGCFSTAPQTFALGRYRRNRLVDRIVAERCLIAFKTQAPQPIPEVHDGAQSPSLSSQPHGEQADIEMISGSACDWYPPSLLFASPGFPPDGLRRWRVAQARRGQDCEEAWWWHRVAWLPPYDGSGNRRDRAGRAGRTLRRGGLNQTERQNKAKCETQPHALLQRLETLPETVSLTCGGAYAKSAESRLLLLLSHGEIRRSRRLSNCSLIQAERHPSEIRGIGADPHQNRCQQTDHTRPG